MHKDKRVDSYISKSADFAKPILIHLRKLVHKACPKVKETIKWNFPNFEYAGGVICSMAAFKQHCSFGFWKASIMKDSHKLFGESETAMGHFGRITKLDDLPSDKILIQYIKEAAELNEKGIKVKKPKSNNEKKELRIPDYFLAALKRNIEAEEKFNKFSYSHKKEYLEWITEAKTEETREKRIETALEWITEGKSRNWKHERK